MADEKKYLGLDGVIALKTALESEMDTKDAAIKASITGGDVVAAQATKATQDASGNVITTTYETKSDATAKLNEAKGYTDSQMTAKVGTVPDGQTVMGIINNIQENAYDDTEVRGLITDNADAISDMDAAYKAADQTLQGNINTEKSEREAADSALDERLRDVETFWAAVETPDDTIDTLAEIVAYINDDKSGAESMLASINKNKEDIATEVSRAKAAEEAISGRVDVLEAIDHDAYIDADTALKNTLTSDIATAKQAAIDAAAADATTKAGAAETAAKTYADGLNTAMDARVDALEAIDHSTYMLKSDEITAAEVTALFA